MVVRQHKIEPGRQIPRYVTMRFPNRAYVDSLLFLSSFAPLFLALAFRFDAMPLRATCLGLSVIGAAWLWGVLAFWKRRSPITAVIASCDDRGPDVGGYLAAYLLPLLVIPEPTAGDIAAYVLILSIIGVVYVRSRMIQLNPLLYVTGYRIWTVTTIEGFTGYLIAKNSPRPGDEISVVRREHVLLALGAP